MNRPTARLLVTLVAAMIATTSFAPATAARTIAVDPGIHYHLDESGVQLDVYLVPSTGPRRVLVALRVECDGFNPEARALVPLRRNRFSLRGTFGDPETTDVVDADIRLTGRFAGRAALRLDLSVDLEAYDNGGPTGSCDREVDLEAAGEPDDGLAALDGTLTLAGHRTPVLAALGDALLVAIPRDRATTLQVVDAGGDVTRRARLDNPVDALAVLADGVWALDADAGVLSEVDLDSGEALASVQVGEPVDATPPGDPGRALSALATSGGTIWTATATEILAIDPVSATVTDRIATGGSRVLELAASDNSVYAVVEDRGDDGLTGRLLRVDAASATIVAEAVLESPFVGPLSVGSDAIWTARPLERRDLASLAVITAGTGELGPSRIVVASPGVWVAGRDALVALDDSFDVELRLPGIRGDALVALDATVWVADAGLGLLLRFRT